MFIRTFCPLVILMRIVGGSLHYHHLFIRKVNSERIKRSSKYPQWDALKNKEKGRTTLADELGTVPVTLPALMRAQKLQKRADRCGAEQSAPETARQALQAALDGWNREQDAQAAGELLFAAANAMRLAGVDAEEALTFASKRYCAELLAQKEQSGTQVE